jgi:hypothetical protein
VKQIKQFHTAKIYRVVTESGLKVGCTFDHPFITSLTDVKGTRAAALKARLDAGEEVFTLTRSDEREHPVIERIVSMTEEIGDFWVGIPSIDGPPIVILNGFVSHNRKADEGFILS